MIHVGESLSGESARQPVNPAPAAVAPSSNSSAPGPPEFATVAPQAGAPSTNSAIATEPGSAGSAANTGDADQPTLTARQTDSGSRSLSPGSQDRQTKTPAEAPRAQKPDSSTFAARSEHAPVSEKSRTRISGDSVNEDDGHTELALAQQYLRGTSVPKDRDMAAHLLWVAVSEGNSQAELELADLYLRTDGVPAKNCAQARILLSASSNSGNLEAGEKLARLRDYGCR
jgi:TPR repeat protein